MAEIPECPQCQDPLDCRPATSEGERRLLQKIKGAFEKEAPPAPQYIYSCRNGCIEEVDGDYPVRSALMVGSRAAGKSTFIASLPLVKDKPRWFQFMNGGTDWIGGTQFRDQRVIVIPTESWGLDHQPRTAPHAAAESGEKLRNYGLYRGIVGAAHTQAGSGRRSSAPQGDTELVRMWLIDMPGEEFKAQTRALLDHAPSVDVVSLVILCVDVTNPLAATDARAALLRVSEINQDDCHLAVVGTKCDELWHLPDFPAELKRGLPPKATPSETATRLAADSEVACEWLSNQPILGDFPFLAGQFSSASFHLVSATSCAPVDRVYPRIEPFRVLDPFMYDYLMTAGLL